MGKKSRRTRTNPLRKTTDPEKQAEFNDFMHTMLNKMTPGEHGWLMNCFHQSAYHTNKADQLDRLGCWWDKEKQGGLFPRWTGADMEGPDADHESRHKILIAAMERANEKELASLQEEINQYDEK